MTGEEFAKTMIVTRRVLQQKELTISMSDGRFAKNEIIVHLTGLPPNFNIGDAVDEASNGMNLMQLKNPILPPMSKPAKALVDKAMKKTENDAEEAS